MAQWKDKTKFLAVGRSGLQYCTSFTCARSADAAERLVTDFYQARRATLSSTGDRHALTFTRGREWMSKYATLLVLSERWLRQTITVSFATQPDALAVDVRYDARLFYAFVIAPCTLVKEARELRTLLETP
jgi:hypothetical protein